MKNKEIGYAGEKIVSDLLEQKGCEILCRNFTIKGGEIDIIAQKKDLIVFVEVKLRKSDAFASAAEFVDLRKQNRLRTTASIYLSEHETDLQPRFDVIEIYAPEGTETARPEIYHMEDAFQ